MVFPGHFSTGCSRCRQRKVKCDEKKPSCRRCYIYGKPCPGYTDQFHFRYNATKSDFEKTRSNSVDSSASSSRPLQVSPKSAAASASARPSTSAAAAKRQQQQQQDKDRQSHETIMALEPTRTTPTSSSSSTAISPVTIIRPPDPSYEEVSLCYFIRRFTSPDGADNIPGHLTFLPSLYDRHGNGLLETATLTVAQMAAYNQFGGDRFRMKSYQNYGRTLKILQEIIQSEEQAVDDKVITAILLLCTFKDLSGESAGDPCEHAPGLFYLLEKRGVEQFATRRGVELFLLSLLRLQVYSFLHADINYTDPGGMVSLLGLFDPMLKAMSLMSRTLALRNELGNTAPQPDVDMSSPASSYEHVDADTMARIQTCFETLEEFDAWDAEAASYWQNTFSCRAAPTTLGSLASNATYYDPETACIIILVRSARLILLTSMLVYFGKSQQMATHGGGMGSNEEAYGQHHHNGVWGECIPLLENDARKTIDDILAAVPYALGDIDQRGLPTSMAHDGAGALVITQSIRLITSNHYCTPDQLERAHSILHRINGVIGIRAAKGWDGESLNIPNWRPDQAFLCAMEMQNPGGPDYPPPVTQPGL